MSSKFPASITAGALLLVVCMACTTLRKDEKSPTTALRPARCLAEPDSFRPLEREVIAEINLVRTKPRLYASYLELRKQHYDGNIYRPPGAREGVRTVEGLRAVDEAIKFLILSDTRDALRHAGCLSLAARDHVNDLGPRGAVGHVGSDGSDPRERVGRYVSAPVAVGENISFGPATARDIVCGLLIDDNVPDRSHRTLIFHRRLAMIGVAFGPHARFRNMCVIDFSLDEILSVESD